jgi:hypothetical protein
MIDLIKKAAQEMELWAIALRYKNGEINEDVNLQIVWNLQRMKEKYPFYTEQSKKILLETMAHLERFEAAPENIKNKVLSIGAFYEAAEKPTKPKTVGAKGSPYPYPNQFFGKTGANSGI